MVQAIHTIVRGRARFEVKGLYRSGALKRLILLRLSNHKGIKSVHASTLTGNVLVFFNTDNTPVAVASIIKNIVFEHEGNKRVVDKGTSPQKQVKVNTSRNPPIKERPYISRRKLRSLIIHSEEQVITGWHLKEAEDILGLLKSSRDSGLSSDSAKEYFKRYGPNIPPESLPCSGLSIFINQFKSLPVALLGVATGISILSGGITDAIFIGAVAGINAVIGYMTESQTEKTILSLKSLVRPVAHVIRDKVVKEVRADEVIPGDILVLRPGSYVAADARLIEAQRLSVDESSLTGESMPAIKTTAPLYEREVPLADRTNMVYMGTLVTGGQGLAVVVATGRFTEISRVKALVIGAEPPETPIQRQLSTMGAQLALISGMVCGCVFLIGLLRGYGLLGMLKSSISLAVAAIPEGLPTVATTTLALGIANMRRHKVLIRRLDSVETLGSVQTICLDKTGTITVNKMSVVSIYAGMRQINVSDGIFTEGHVRINPYTRDELLRLIHVTTLCNESEVTKKDSGYTLNGSPTENALIHMAISAGADIGVLRERYPVLKINYRAEDRNFMSTVHAAPRNKRVIAIKGSPAEVLSMCSFHIKDGETLPLTDDDRRLIEIANERMAGDALRVLGVAYTFIDEGQGSRGRGQEENKLNLGYLPLDPKSLVWLGLIGMADPVRKGVKDSIRSFHKAGIETVMITGDQSPTAYAIGKELNLSGNGQLEILDSAHLQNIEPEVLTALCKRVRVFSRVSPAHKIQIVQSLQNAGKVVAMTGDGINDSPALKAADIGIAMGHTGTDVAREVADVILEDDNIETMIIAINQGRTIYNNIRKSIHFLFSTNLSEIMVMFTAISVGLGQPLTAMQLLWINLISDIAPAIALALEPPEPDVLSRPPRDPSEPIIKASDFKRIILQSATLSAGAMTSYGYGIARYGMRPEASTMAFMSLTSGQILHSISCRSEKPVIFANESLPPNRYLNMAIGGSLFVQLLAITVPALRGLLGLTPLSILDGIVIGSSAAMPLVVNEMTKGGET